MLQLFYKQIFVFTMWRVIERPGPNKIYQLGRLVLLLSCKQQYFPNPLHPPDHCQLDAQVPATLSPGQSQRHPTTPLFHLQDLRFQGNLPFSLGTFSLRPRSLIPLWTIQFSLILLSCRRVNSLVWLLTRTKRSLSSRSITTRSPKASGRPAAQRTTRSEFHRRHLHPSLVGDLWDMGGGS